MGADKTYWIEELEKERANHASQLERLKETYETTMRVLRQQNETLRVERDRFRADLAGVRGDLLTLQNRADVMGCELTDVTTMCTCQVARPQAAAPAGAGDQPPEASGSTSHLPSPPGVRELFILLLWFWN